MGFDKYEQIKPVNTDIFIKYNPENYSSYKLTIYKDDNVYSEFENVGESNITLTESGKYKIVVEGTETVSSGEYYIDKEPPILNISQNYIKDENVLDYVSATDSGVDISSNITYKEISSSNNIKKIEISVSDEAGNIATKNILMSDIKTTPSIIILQTIFMLILFIIVICIYIYNKSIKLEKFISKYSISPLKEENFSLFDKINNFINENIKKINNILYKSLFLKKYSKRYTKYIFENSKTSMDFISIKFMCSLASIIIALFSKTMQLKVFRLYDIYIPLVFGFFIPDIIYYIKYKSHRKKMENDLLQAIIIMNNAFKSGRSITQAIELVSNELEGTIAREFKKMYLELSFGLGLDVVFSRFYERVNIEEVAYLTASLTILNRTGGNIVEVFSSIEKSLFNKKKLRLELNSLTSGSRIIVRVLMIVPLAFILLIGFINPTYFLPLLTTNLGYIIISIILILYILYIILVRKLLKVKI